MNNKKRKKEILKELAEIEAKEKGIDNKEKKHKRLNVVIALILGFSILGAVIWSWSNNINNSKNGESSYSEYDNSSEESDEFTITDANEEQATEWLKDDEYENDFDHSDNTLDIKCFDSSNSGYIDGMKVCLHLEFETKETNDSDYPFELVSPTYELIIPVKNTYQIISKVVIKTDNDRFELDNESLQTEILSDEEYTGLISEISISKLKSIADSSELSISMYDNKGEEMYSCDSEEQLDNIKDQIRVGEVFYSLKGTTWTFD